ADLLGTRDDDLIRKNQVLEFIQKSREDINNLFCPLHPARRWVNSASAETHVVTHHARTRQRLEKIENLFPLAECIHERSAPGSHIAEQKSEQRCVICQSG